MDETERHGVPLLRTDLSVRDGDRAPDALPRGQARAAAPWCTASSSTSTGSACFCIGDSGVGKSECAIDLVVRGHRLVSDDVVEIKQLGDHLVGTGPELTRYHMELRGVGIINVKDLFGVASVRLTKYVEFVIKLDPWKAGKKYDRLGLDDNGLRRSSASRCRYVEMPVGPGRNLSVLIEVAARNHLLKLKGYHPARELARKLGERIQAPVDDAAGIDQDPRAGDGETR